MSEILKLFSISDEIRGLTTSSSRREVPSSVFGINTPGPIDKEFVASGTISTARTGGTSFVMDDGDDKFIRKTKAKEGPMEVSGHQFVSATNMNYYVRKPSI